jgi:hypothetical protein
MFCPDLQQRISVSGVVAVLSIEKPEHAVPLANALMEGGVDCIELTLRTPLAMDAARAILAHCPRMTLGIGTILTVDQVKPSASPREQTRTFFVRLHLVDCLLLLESARPATSRQLLK